MNTDPITREEMVAMFGSEMPIEAVELLFNSPDTKTFGEIRAELRAIAAANPNPTSPSEGAMRAAELIVEEYVLSIDGIERAGDVAGIARIIDRHIAADAGVREAARKYEIIENESGRNPVISIPMDEVLRWLRAWDVLRLCKIPRSTRREDQSQMADLARIIAELEKATGPSRELDCLIYGAIHYPKRDDWKAVSLSDGDQPASAYGSRWVVLTHSMEPHHQTHVPPKYSSSIDDALTLVPTPSVKGDNGKKVVIDWDERRSLAFATVNWDHNSQGATPAIALCIAALRARQALSEEGL